MPEALIVEFAGVSDPTAVRRVPLLAYHLPGA
jgi:hypothetical protein